jgi:hypothetical protein
MTTDVAVGDRQPLPVSTSTRSGKESDEPVLMVKVTSRYPGTASMNGLEGATTERVTSGVRCGRCDMA